MLYGTTYHRRACGFEQHLMTEFSHPTFPAQNFRALLSNETLPAATGNKL
jgi:hypothetical protein